MMTTTMHDDLAPELGRPGRFAGWVDDTLADNGGALYDEAAGPRDPHRRPPAITWPPDEHWTPPVTVVVEHTDVIAPPVYAEHEPPSGYRWACASTPSRSTRIHLVAHADLAVRRVDGRTALCGALDWHDVPDPDGRVVCPSCWEVAHR